MEKRSSQPFIFPQLGVPPAVWLPAPFFLLDLCPDQFIGEGLMFQNFSS